MRWAFRGRSNAASGSWAMPYAKEKTESRAPSCVADRWSSARMEVAATPSEERSKKLIRPAAKSRRRDAAVATERSRGGVMGAVAGTIHDA